MQLAGVLMLSLRICFGTNFLVVRKEEKCYKPVGHRAQKQRTIKFL